MTSIICSFRVQSALNFKKRRCIAIERGKKVLLALESAGHEAYFVGGCVRDLLLKRPIHDWDITTSALPSQVMDIFQHCIPTGLQHGTITVLEEGNAYEVTTYRTDGGYQDGRHPERVEFIADLEGDLLRRDFTINAMAMDARGVLKDMHGGREDLSHGLLRCVGNPVHRFEEDALRMLRAIRFSAQLGFMIEEKTAQAMAQCAPLCAKLSPERVRDEMEKTLLSPRPEVIGEMLRLRMLQPFGIDGAPDLSQMTTLPPVRAVRWAGLLRALPTLDLVRLRLDKKTISLCTRAVQVYQTQYTVLEIKRIIASGGYEVAECACALSGQGDLLSRIIESGDCVTLAQLAVRGSDFPERKGAEVGEVLHALLDYVLAHPEKNTRGQLMDAAKKLEREGRE